MRNVGGIDAPPPIPLHVSYLIENRDYLTSIRQGEGAPFPGTRFRSRPLDSGGQGALLSRGHGSDPGPWTLAGRERSFPGDTVQIQAPGLWRAGSAPFPGTRLRSRPLDSGGQGALLSRGHGSDPVPWTLAGRERSFPGDTAQIQSLGLWRAGSAPFPGTRFRSRPLDSGGQGALLSWGHGSDPGPWTLAGRERSFPGDTVQIQAPGLWRAGSAPFPGTRLRSRPLDSGGQGALLSRGHGSDPGPWTLAGRERSFPGDTVQIQAPGLWRAGSAPFPGDTVQIQAPGLWRAGSAPFPGTRFRSSPLDSGGQGALLSRGHGSDPVPWTLAGRERSFPGDTVQIQSLGLWRAGSAPFLGTRLRSSPLDSGGQGALLSRGHGSDPVPWTLAGRERSFPGDTVQIQSLGLWRAGSAPFPGTRFRSSPLDSGGQGALLSRGHGSDSVPWTLAGRERSFPGDTAQIQSLGLWRAGSAPFLGTRFRSRPLDSGGQGALLSRGHGSDPGPWTLAGRERSFPGDTVQIQSLGLWRAGSAPFPGTRFRSSPLDSGGQGALLSWGHGSDPVPWTLAGRERSFPGDTVQIQAPGLWRAGSAPFPGTRFRSRPLDSGELSQLTTGRI
ncbi:uncharacterized protein [Scyliorhinus torazame]|uniref:uncharacterized protein n=1 Tax=Scyliorhinus torazame TaxID=75743 RepID=UPI003B5BF156